MNDIITENDRIFVEITKRFKDIFIFKLLTKKTTCEEPKKTIHICFQVLSFERS